MDNHDFPWKDKVINIHQIGGIETSLLDDGAGRGCRIAWINTGSGLRFKVAIDRALDIVDAFYNQHSLAWLSHAGLTSPRPDANAGIEWLYSFAGGLLTTCGLSSMGAPDSDESEDRGLHGRISNAPASVESIIQPDPQAGQMEMSITAVTKESRIFSPNLEIKRTISSTLGESVIRIGDTVTNRSNTTVPHMLLYHCNFGWPLVDEGVDILYKGKCDSRGGDGDNALFSKKHNFKKCIAPQEDHKASGEACGFIDVEPNEKGECTVGLANTKINLAMLMRFNKEQLPVVTNWQHWGVGEYTCALEPGTNPPLGQNAAREAGTLIMLEPGERRHYDLEIRIVSEADQIRQLLSDYEVCE